MPARMVLAIDVANDMAEVYAMKLDGGALVLYQDTTAAPATAEDPLPVDAVELARFALPVDASDVVDGVVTMKPLDPVPGLASGRVGWACVARPSGTPVLLPNVGTDDEALVLSSLDVVAGEDVTVVDWSFYVPTLVEEAAP